MKITIRENEKAHLENAFTYIKGKAKAEKLQYHCESGHVAEAIDTITRALNMMWIFADAPGTTFTNETDEPENNRTVTKDEVMAWPK